MVFIVFDLELAVGLPGGVQVVVRDIQDDLEKDLLGLLAHLHLVALQIVDELLALTEEEAAEDGERACEDGRLGER